MCVPCDQPFLFIPVQYFWPHDLHLKIWPYRGISVSSTHFVFRYAQYLSKEDDESLIPFCTAVGDPETLIEFSCSRGQLSHAVLTAQVACEGVFDEMSQTYASKGLCNGVEPNKSYQK